MRALWSQCRWQRDMLILNLAVIGVMYVFGLVMQVVLFDGADSVIEMGTLLCMIGFFILSLFEGMQMINAYNYPLAFGQTRKATFPAFAASVFLLQLVAGCVIKVLYLLEHVFIGIVFPNAWIESIGEIQQWKYLLPVVIGMTSLSVILGALVMRWGKTAYMIVYIAMIVFGVGMSRTAEYLSEHYADSAAGRLADRMIAFVLTHIGQTLWIGALAAGVLFLGGAYLLVRKQEVSV